MVSLTGLKMQLLVSSRHRPENATVGGCWSQVCTFSSARYTGPEPTPGLQEMCPVRNGTPESAAAAWMHTRWLCLAARGDPGCGYPADSSDLAAGAAGAATCSPSPFRRRTDPGLPLTPCHSWLTARSRPAPPMRGGLASLIQTA